MNFLEKDLETIIWDNYEGCYTRGLDITEIGARFGESRHRQVGLGPYGIADLVNVQYFPQSQRLFIQVIECKKDEINASTYGQAKRYLTAVKHVIKHRYGIDESNTTVRGEIILIGRRFDNKDDFPFIYNADDECHAYTYSYELEGLTFSSVPKSWNRNLKGADGAVAVFASAFERECDALFEADKRHAQSYAQALLDMGDPSSVLLVTSYGVLVNTQRLDDFEERGY